MVNAPAHPILTGVIAVRRTLHWAPFTTTRDDRPRGRALLHCRHAPHLSCCPVCRTGGWSLDGCVAPAVHHTTHHNPHHYATWCDAASPSPPCECPLSASGRPATSERGVPGRTTAAASTNLRCGQRSLPIVCSVDSSDQSCGLYHNNQYYP